MTNFDRDPVDDALGRALRQRAGTGGASIAAAHDAVLARAGLVRRRRAAVVGGGTMMVLLIGGFVTLSTGGDDSLAPANTGESIPGVTLDDPATTDPNGSTSPSTGDTTSGTVPTSAGLTDDTVTDDTLTDDTAVTTGSAVGGPTSTGVGQGTVTSPSSTVGGSAPTSSTATTATTSSSTVTTQASTSSTDNATSSSASSTSEPDTPPPGPFTEPRTYSAPGGSITVDWNGSALSLVSVSPGPGFQSEVKDNTSTRIRVDFDNGSDQSRIEVRFTGSQITVTTS